MAGLLQGPVFHAVSVHADVLMEEQGLPVNECTTSCYVPYTAGWLSQVHSTGKRTRGNLWGDLIN